MTPPPGTDDLEKARAVMVLLEMYKENTNHGRHLETQRQLVTGFILTLAGAALAALATLKFPKGACVGLGAILIAFGLVGTIFSVVQYGKWTHSRARWRAARSRLAELCPLAVLGKNTAPERSSHWLRVGKFPLHWLWTFLVFSVFILGFLLMLNADTLASWGMQQNPIQPTSALRQ